MVVTTKGSENGHVFAMGIGLMLGLRIAFYKGLSRRMIRVDRFPQILGDFSH